ncbi:glycosyltransferase family 8 protein [Helicobacter rodentium]|uniref:glycosyltransferase family 8 protein n=1 Tax=Helicobacter rodentium TaxID=59617 RepID=UPI002354DBCE|nr:glycosyltransferase family 8 protein [Helicobacter rodentium]
MESLCQINILPAFSEKIAIVFGVDSKYISYLSVALESFKRNCKTDTYDIIIMYLDLRDEQKTIIQQTYSSEKIRIRFIDLTETIKNYQELQYTNAYLTSAMYIRFFIPQILSNYQKVIYCDCDVVFLKDISQLYHLTLENALLGVVKDTENLRQHYINSNFVSYCQNTLHLNNSLNYFQSGVLVFNIKQCLEEKLLEQCLEALSKISKPIYPDQDILNIAAENKVKFLQGYWNVENHILAFNRNNLANLSSRDLKEYEDALTNVAILHYSGDRKPWNLPTIPNATIWWDYARKTPFYEEIIYHNICKSIESHCPKNNVGAVARVKNTLSYRLGNAIVKAKSPIKICFLPFLFLWIIIQYKQDIKIYESLCKINSFFIKPPLYTYIDYEECLKTKQHLSYQLGNLLVKSPFSFPFKFFQIYKKFKANQ